MDGVLLKDHGIEYSLVLITILTAIFIAERKAVRNISHLL